MEVVDRRLNSALNIIGPFHYQRVMFLRVSRSSLYNDEWMERQTKLNLSEKFPSDSQSQKKNEYCIQFVNYFHNRLSSNSFVFDHLFIEHLYSFMSVGEFTSFGDYRAHTFFVNINHESVLNPSPKF